MHITKTGEMLSHVISNVCPCVQSRKIRSKVKVDSRNQTQLQTKHKTKKPLNDLEAVRAIDWSRCDSA